MADKSMALPPGKTCADCTAYERCKAFIGERWINDKQTLCDWAPSRFVQRPGLVYATDRGSNHG